METAFQVETIGYFENDGGDGEKSPSPLPVKMNDNLKYTEVAFLKFPFLNLNVEANHLKPLQQNPGNLQSLLLHFYKSDSSPTSVKPNVVTDLKTLIAICSTSSEASSLSLRVFQRSGVVFIWKEGQEDDNNKNYDDLFRNFFIQDPQRARTTGIFQAKFSLGRGEYCSLLYSGEVVAIDASHQHYSFKVVSSPPTTFDFWEHHSAEFYWNAVFGNIPTVLVGTRTGTIEKDPKTRKPLSYPELSVYKVEKLDRDSIPSKTSLFAAKPKATFNPWSIAEGEARLQELLKFIKKNSDGELTTISRIAGSEKWTVVEEEDGEIQKEMRDLIRDFQF